MKKFRGKLAVLCVALCLVSGAVMAQHAGNRQGRFQSPKQGARAEQMRSKMKMGREFTKNHPELQADVDFLKESRKEMRTLSQKYQNAKIDTEKESIKAEMTQYASRIIDAKNRVQKVKLADDQKKLNERKAKFDEQITGKDKAVDKLVQAVLSGKKGEKGRKGNRDQTMNKNRKAGKNDRGYKQGKSDQRQKNAPEMREQRKEVAALVKQYKQTDDASEKKTLEKKIRSKVADGYDQKIEAMEQKLNEKKSSKDQQIDKMVTRILEGKQGRR